MQQSDLRVGGSVVFFRNSPTSSYSLLASGLNQRGLSQYTPEPRSPAEALKVAISEKYGAAKGEKNTIDSMPTEEDNEYCYAISSRAVKTRVRPGDQVGECKAVVTAKGTDTAGWFIDSEPYVSGQWQADLLTEFSKARQDVTAAAVTAKLVDIIVKHLGGWSLRDGGAIYWVPEPRIAEMRDIASVFEMAGRDSKTKVYTLKVALDAETVKAAGDGLTAEVEAIVAEIEAELEKATQDGFDSFGTRACKNRLEKVEGLQEKVQRYVTAFSDPKDFLQQKLDSIQEYAAVCVFQSSAAEARERGEMEDTEAEAQPVA
jgi:hypothetical protein